MVQRVREGATILLAEDEADLRNMFRDMLTFRGYAVRLAEDGDACLRAAREATPDLVILDIMMPRRSGIETAAELRRLPGTATTPILALTALADPDVHRRVLAAGCDLVLTKPILPRDLVRGVELLLEESDQAERFASREQTDAAELVRQAADLVPELSADVPEMTETELRQRTQGIQIVPACSSCGRVRLADGEWKTIPRELRAYFEQWTSVSHGICPDCLARDFPGLRDGSR